MKKYVVNVGVDCSYFADVHAMSPEDAAEFALGEPPTGLCHQCSDHFQLEPSATIWTRVMDDDGEEVFVDGTLNDAERIAELERRISELEDENAALRRANTPLPERRTKDGHDPRCVTVTHPNALFACDCALAKRLDERNEP